MLPGVRPIICLASTPTATTALVSVSTATTDGSFSKMPRPRAYTSVFAVPRSSARSLPSTLTRCRRESSASGGNATSGTPFGNGKLRGDRMVVAASGLVATRGCVATRVAPMRSHNRDRPGKGAATTAAPVPDACCYERITAAYIVWWYWAVGSGGVDETHHTT